MNLVTPQVRRRGLAEAREGRCFLLGLPLDYPKGKIFAGRNPPRLDSTHGSDGRVMYDWTFRDAGTDLINDDRVIMDLQYSSQ